MGIAQSTALKIRYRVLWATLALVLSVPAYMIYHQEQILSHGTTLFLKLAPRDPRSLMQGDYMALNYNLANTLRERLKQEWFDGKVVVKLDEHGIAWFDRIHDASNVLEQDEHLLRVRKRGSNVRLATNAFFFQEGQAQFYVTAQYGELKVAASGESVLVGLRDADLMPLGPPQKQY